MKDNSVMYVNIKYVLIGNTGLKRDLERTRSARAQACETDRHTLACTQALCQSSKS